MRGFPFYSPEPAELTRPDVRLGRLHLEAG